ncbi:hypothetical protein YC2023_033962 [Brassica napus]
MLVNISYDECEFQINLKRQIKAQQQATWHWPYTDSKQYDVLAVIYGDFGAVAGWCGGVMELGVLVHR